MLRIKYLIVGSVSTLLIGGILKYYLHRKRKAIRKRYPKDVVILHQFPEGLHAPSASPFSLKLETWLRFTDIKYQNEIVYLDRSPKGKVPWITLNNKDVSDSQFCIEYLTKHYGIDLSDNLTKVEKSIGRAFFKLIEESLKWVILIHRFKYGNAEDVAIPYLFFLIIGRKFLKEAQSQGYLAHSKDELYEIGIQDLKSIETFLGNKKYLFGDTPTVEDATIFGFTTQIVFHDVGPLNDYILSQCPNLIRHCATIKETYWPDWNERVKEPI